MLGKNFLNSVVTQYTHKNYLCKEIRQKIYCLLKWKPMLLGGESAGNICSFMLSCFLTVFSLVIIKGF